MSLEEGFLNQSQSSEAGSIHNQLLLTAKLVAKSVLRFTPAGVPVCEFELEHESLQLEASKSRQVRCVISAIALGNAANQIQILDLGCIKNWLGFVALRSHKSKSLRFHVCAVRPVEGL